MGCWLRHDWSKWTMYKALTKMPWQLEWSDELRERRSCSRCGTTQDRPVSS